ncbi:cobalamin biosynthesis protein CobD [Acidovorax sp. SRB_14]|uniref:adenosylcobinamide-phosphate synthase CbiB n=1 Tax=Acidovorax sp. SRB_14 TaxID=1962699 RepID=UPI001566E51E|nr:adenosylcobinamide-phosphate synthase CbiB [Acidovorax sp. SRB_14]NMM80941.1 cobalamin biosynthesis protein CobD [Acidovorax sp. SRB_14]
MDLFALLHPLAAQPLPGAACVLLALLVALAVDARWGEPPARWHPVVWMGRALGALDQRIAPAAATGRDWKCFWLAALAWSALAAMVLVVSVLLQAAVLGAWVPVPPAGALQAAARCGLTALLLGLLLKPLLALALLQSEVRAVEAALGESLGAGRARLAWLVSRDVAQLSADEVRQSAIESLAENLNDSVVAPLFWFVLLGLPGAALYRLANTADAMWGYPGLRGGRYWQWAGKWAARADDALSWLPARLTALLLALAAGGVPLRALAREARRTPSPNSGWPMAAMALALGVRLSKPGAYCLHATGRAPTQGDAQRAQALVSKVALALVLLALTALVLIVIGMLHHG